MGTDAPWEGNRDKQEASLAVVMSCLSQGKEGEKTSAAAFIHLLILMLLRTRRS